MRIERERETKVRVKENWEEEKRTGDGQKSDTSKNSDMSEGVDKSGLFNKI